MVLTLCEQRHQQQEEPAPPPLSAAHQVFAITELLETILSHLPPSYAHGAKRVSRRFHDILSNERAGLDLRRALGLIPYNFPRGLSPEAACRFFHGYVVQQNPRRIFNAALGSPFSPVSEPFPRLKLLPYLQVSFIVDETVRIATLRFRLDAGKIGGERGSPSRKGVVQFQSTMPGTRNKVYDARLVESWARILIFSVALLVKVKVTVDFRESMHEPGHCEGPCGFRHCQVGSHGLQHVSTLRWPFTQPQHVHQSSDHNSQTMKAFQPAGATLGNLLGFLDEVEEEVSKIVGLIDHIDDRHRATCHAPYQWTGQILRLPQLRLRSPRR